MSFAFIPSAVKKKKPVLVSSHAPSASISVGAKVTSGSVDNSKGTKDQASSESIKNKIKHASRSETKPSTTATSITGRKDLFDLEDLAQLVCLALSDYAVWADVDLRRKIDWGNNQDHYHDDELIHDASIDDNSGYIPLAYIMRHSQVFRLASSSPSLINQPQTTFIKAIRTHASHLIDVRLIIPSSSSSTIPKNGTAHWTKPHNIQTGYELRRKEVLSALSKHGKKEWDALTIYAENIPDQYRSIPGIIRLFNGLLPPSLSFTNPSVPRIQYISLPSHHQDQPNSIPTFKSFALVTLSYEEDLDALLKAWPWDHPMDVEGSDRPVETGFKSAVANPKGKGRDGSLPDEEISPFYVGATKFGLRILTKARWEELRAEYLLYRQELVDEINMFQDEGEVRVYGGCREGYVGEMHDQEKQEDLQKTIQIQVQKRAHIQSRSTESAAIAANDSVDAAGIHPNSTYPLGCLVFVRNVHPETNKTTLRRLFLHARGPIGIVSGKKDDDGLDYLDYTKGMDCCYVRLRTPLHSQQLVHCLSSTPIIQTSGLDASGASLAHLSLLGKSDSPITAEQVLGKREEVYWQKVPEKIRRQAVDKALSLLPSGM